MSNSPNQLHEEPRTALPELSLAQVLLTAQNVLSGRNPLPDQSPYYARHVEEKLFEFAPVEYDMSHLSGFLSPEECEELATSRELQRRILEPAIRETLELIRDFRGHRSNSLTFGVLQVYRRELTWLMGRWLEAAGTEFEA
jgi:hypothetical protein